MEVSGQLHALAALPPGKEPLVPIGSKLKSMLPRSVRENSVIAVSLVSGAFLAYLKTIYQL
jgi:hypothetical protein